MGLGCYFRAGSAAIVALLALPGVSFGLPSVPDVNVPQVTVPTVTVPDVSLPGGDVGTPQLPALPGEQVVPATGPVVATGDPAAVSTSGGTLTGAVNPRGLPTTYHFEYGSTPLYGSSTPAANAGSGTSPVQVSAPLSGLPAGSIVHYRLVASNTAGQNAGLDHTLIVIASGLAQNAPHLTSVNAPQTTTVGKAVTLTASGTDPDATGNLIAVDFDDGPGFFTESACRSGPKNPIFDKGKLSSFAVPYTFARPGRHTVKVTLGSGGCGGRTQRTTQTVVVNVARAKTAAERTRGREMVALAAAGCKGAGALPNRRNVKKIETATLCLLNAQRRAHKLGRFRRNAKLRKAAALHNSYMRRKRSFSHQVPGEPSFGARLKRVGYNHAGGENLAAGAGMPYATPRSMIVAWMNSTLHRANILEKRWHTIGIAVMPQMPSTPPTPGATYTTEFGATRK
jgi:uncharacterized protein YkwD